MGVFAGDAVAEGATARESDAEDLVRFGVGGRGIGPVEGANNTSSETGGLARPVVSC
jgi:hypothetical protein